MSTNGYLRGFRERWVLIAIASLIGLSVAFGITRVITPTYSATGTLFLSVESATASLFERSQFSLQRIKSYPDLVKSPDLVSAVAAELGSSDTPAEIATRLSAENPANTVLLNVTAEAEDPELAAAIANAAAGNLARLVDELENGAASSDSEVGRSTIRLDLTLPAQPPLSPDSPDTPVILGLGLLAGTAGGLIAAILLERLLPRIRTTADVRYHTDLPVLGQLPVALSKKWIYDDEPVPGPVVIALRDTVRNLTAILNGHLPQAIGLTPVDEISSRPGTRVGLARFLAGTGRRVVLVEADKSRQAETGLAVADASPGLAEIMRDARRDASATTVWVANEKFRVLPAGNGSDASAEFGSERSIKRAFVSLAADFDVTIAQPTHLAKPASLDVLAPAVHGVVLVVTYSRTSAHGLERQLSRVRALGLVPLGVIIAAVPHRHREALFETWQSGDFVDTRSPGLESDSEPEPEGSTVPPPARIPQVAPSHARSHRTSAPSSDRTDAGQKSRP